VASERDLLIYIFVIKAIASCCMFIMFKVWVAAAVAYMLVCAQERVIHFITLRLVEGDSHYCCEKDELERERERNCHVEKS